MKIVLNGKEETLPDGLTVRELLDRMKVAPELVACEHNREIVRRKDYPNVRISEGDRIEIIQMIGGG